MERIPEPELMDDRAQAEAYAAADFEEAHRRFIELAGEHLDPATTGGFVLDLGCGPGDIAIRFARAYPRCVVHGVDGAEAMLAPGRKILAGSPELAGRVELFQGFLPGARLPRDRYETLISNSLLHHLHDPAVLWNAMGLYGAPQARVFLMDLRRPESPGAAAALVAEYAAGEPEVLRRDFYNSLLAAFEPDEIKTQLERAGLPGLTVTAVGDRHVTVAGRL
jgi:ubiquinone/menaquinone biosynthesis C-methylase UbiE